MSGSYSVDVEFTRSAVVEYGGREHVVSIGVPWNPEPSVSPASPALERLVALALDQHGLTGDDSLALALFDLEQAGELAVESVESGTASYERADDEDS